MKRALGILVVGCLMLPGMSLAAAPRQAFVYTIDGQMLNATVSDDSFGIRTPYGTLDVPTGEISALYPGFRVGETTQKRIDGIIGRLTGPNKDAAVRDLTYMGRITVPQLQAAANGDDKKLAREAKAVLKTIWPTGAKVPSDGSGLLRTKDTEFRGTLTFRSVKLEGSFGRKTVLKSGIRLIQFGRTKSQPATDPPEFAPARGGKTPDLEIVMKDGSRIVGTIDAYSFDVETLYGKLTVPVKELISVTLGDPDEVVTRSMTFRGTLSTTTLNIDSKVGDFRLDRGKVQVVKAVLDETGTTVVQGGEVKPNQWSDIFNGTDLAGWRKWGKGTGKVEDGTIHLAGDAGLTYQNMGDVRNAIVAAKVRINNQTGQGPGIKLTVRDGEEGTYLIHFDGHNGAIIKWDGKAKKSIQLKNFQTDTPAANWHAIPFGILENLMLAYINGKPIGEVRIKADEALPAGKISIGVWNCDANFRDIRVKTLTR